MSGVVGEQVENLLRQAAEKGDTATIIHLLQRGAPFVVDMVGN